VLSVEDRMGIPDSQTSPISPSAALACPSRQLADGQRRVLIAVPHSLEGPLVRRRDRLLAREDAVKVDVSVTTCSTGQTGRAAKPRPQSRNIVGITYRLRDAAGCRRVYF
jgi:hypothetical protein